MNGNRNCKFYSKLSQKTPTLCMPLNKTFTALVRYVICHTT